METSAECAKCESTRRIKELSAIICGMSWGTGRTNRLDEQGRSEAAIECLRTTLRVAPDYTDAMFNIALLLQRTNQYAEAADYWRRYLTNDCQSDWASRARRSLKFCEMQINLIASA